MQKIQRLAAVGAMAALTVALGACGSSETPSAEAPASSAPASSSAAEESTSAAAGEGEGVTTIEDIFGPACDQVPTEGEGSAEGMIDDPVATAASNNPLLSTLVTAVGAVDGLADTLNSAEALTVFAPFNGAFEEEAAGGALPDGTVDALLADPATLGPLLQGHVVGERLDAEGLVAAGTVDVLSGGTVTIGGTADAPTFDGGNGTAAMNLCGNVPTANATVFVIDTVLMPAA